MLEGCSGGEGAVLGPSSCWNPARNGIPRRVPCWPGVLPGKGSGKQHSLVGDQLQGAQEGWPTSKKAELGWAQHSAAGKEAKHKFVSANKPASVFFMPPPLGLDVVLWRPGLSDLDKSLTLSGSQL